MARLEFAVLGTQEGADMGLDPSLSVVARNYFVHVWRYHGTSYTKALPGHVPASNEKPVCHTLCSIWA
jgi:hypothetical protein